MVLMFCIIIYICLLLESHLLIVLRVCICVDRSHKKKHKKHKHKKSKGDNNDENEWLCFQKLTFNIKVFFAIWFAVAFL